MITVACPHPQTVRTRTISHIPEQSPSSPEHAGALAGSNGSHTAHSAPVMSEG
jgi:hypothetical protein